jgi:hypothetical protein
MMTKRDGMGMPSRNTRRIENSLPTTDFFFVIN